MTKTAVVSRRNWMISNLKNFSTYYNEMADHRLLSFHGRLVSSLKQFLLSTHIGLMYTDTNINAGFRFKFDILSITFYF